MTDPNTNPYMESHAKTVTVPRATNVRKVITKEILLSLVTKTMLMARIAIWAE